MQIIDGRYELLELIASGGMASVWRARDRRLERLVALKRPHPGTAGSDPEKRMNREARAAAALSHPNLVTIYDYGTDDEGPYLVMELLEGPTLQDRFGEVQVSEAIDIGAQIADGLAVIHQAGIVHRDVKPANVIMSGHGPRLTDFGIATDPTLVGEITDPGQVVATPAYAAPEVLRGEEQTLASDVYSLATVIDALFESAGSRLDSHLQSVLDTARAESPADRPTAGEFAAALRNAAPTVSRPLGRGSTMVLDATPRGPERDEIHAQPRRRPFLVAVSVLAVAAIGLVALGLSLASDDPNANASPSPTDPLSSTTTTTLETTTTTAAIDTTVPTAVDALRDVRDRLEAVLLEPPRSELNAPEVEDLMKKVDDAVLLAGHDELEEAEQKLEEVAERINEKLSGESHEDSIAMLEEIAGILGLELETPDDDE